MMQEMNYIRFGDYYIPDIRLPEETRPIGRWGRMYREYLKEHHPLRFNDLVLSGQLWTYLADLNEQAQDRLERVIDQMNGFEVDGRRIHVEVSQARVEPGEKRKGRKERKGGRAAGFGGFKAKREGGKRKEKRRDEAPKSRKESRKAEKKEGKKKKFYEDAPGYKKRK